MHDGANGMGGPPPQVWPKLAASAHRLPLVAKRHTSVLALLTDGCRALKGSGALSRKASTASLLLFSAAAFSLSAGGSSP